MINLEQLRKQLAAWQKACEKVKPLRAALSELEERTKRIIATDYRSIRESRYGSVIEQCKEAINNRHADQGVRAALLELWPSLEKAAGDESKARELANHLCSELSEAIREMLGELAGELMRQRDDIKSKIATVLQPFTSEQSALGFADQTDCLVRLDHLVSTCSIFTDPAQGVAKVCSVSQELEKCKALIQ